MDCLDKTNYMSYWSTTIQCGKLESFWHLMSLISSSFMSFCFIFCFSTLDLIITKISVFMHFLVFHQLVRTTRALGITNGLLERVGCHFRPKNTKDDTCVATPACSIVTSNIEESRVGIEATSRHGVLNVTMKFWIHAAMFW